MSTPAEDELAEQERENRAGISELAIRVAEEVWIQPRRDEYETVEEVLAAAQRLVASDPADTPTRPATRH